MERRKLYDLYDIWHKGGFAVIRMVFEKRSANIIKGLNVCNTSHSNMLPSEDIEVKILNIYVYYELKENSEIPNHRSTLLDMTVPW